MVQFYDHDRIIEIYEYDAINKYYKGQRSYDHKKGTGLPANSTDIPIPSLQCKVGFIYIFHEEQWQEVEDNFNKVEIEEINYVFSEKLPESFQEIKILNPLLYFPVYPTIHNFINPHLKSMFLAKKMSLIQKNISKYGKFIVHLLK